MSKTIRLPEELCYIFGLLALGLGAGLMEHAGFGLSMVVAPAYVLHVTLVDYLPWFSFGVAEDVVQLLLLLVMMPVVKRFRISYAFSFVSAVLYGLILDGMVLLTGLIPSELLVVRILMYAVGLVFSATGVAFMLRTYIPPEIYELFVREVSDVYHLEETHVKLVYDIFSCVVAAALSFLLLRRLEGVGWGTVVCALVNGILMGIIGKAIDKRVTYTRWIPKRKK